MRLAGFLILLFVPTIAQAEGVKYGGGGTMAGAVLQMFASLAVVIGIIYLLYYASNRWFKGLRTGKGRSGLIRVVETRHLAPKRSLHIVEVAGEYLLLSNGSEGMRLIKTLEAGDEFESCDRDTVSRQTPEAFLRKFNGILDKSLAGLHAVMESDSRKIEGILKRDGGCK
jgi:flagellar protein FliO/FliZ